MHCTGYGKDRDLSKKFWCKLPTSDISKCLWILENDVSPCNCHLGMVTVIGREFFFHPYISTPTYVYCLPIDLIANCFFLFSCVDVLFNKTQHKNTNIQRRKILGNNHLRSQSDKGKSLKHGMRVSSGCRLVKLQRSMPVQTTRTVVEVSLRGASCPTGNFFCSCCCCSCSSSCNNNEFVFAR